MPDFMSAEVDKLFDALAEAQLQLKVAPKDSKNPHFNSKYADLQAVWETIKLPLTRNKLAVSQVLNESGEHATLTTILAHSSGQWIKSITPIKLKVSRINKATGEVYEITLTPQEFCSAVTYFRRMALSAITGCYAGEADDDGNEAEKINEPVKVTVHKPAPKKSDAEIAKEFSICFADMPKSEKLVEYIDFCCEKGNISPRDFMEKNMKDRDKFEEYYRRWLSKEDVKKVEGSLV